MVLHTIGKVIDAVIKFVGKYFLALIGVLVILLIVVGILTHVALVVGVFVGAFLSATMYKIVDKKLKLHLPEYFFWHMDEIMDSALFGRAEVENKKMEMRGKQEQARAELTKMQQKLRNVMAAKKDIKMKLKTASVTERLQEKAKLKAPLMKMRKGILLQMEDMPWIEELSTVNEDVDWNRYM